MSRRPVKRLGAARTRGGTRARKSGSAADARSNQGQAQNGTPPRTRPSRLTSDVAPADARPSFTQDFSTAVCMPTCAGRPPRQPPLLAADFGSCRVRCALSAAAVARQHRGQHSRQPGPTRLAPSRKRANPLFFSSPRALSSALCVSRARRDDTRQEAGWLGAAFFAGHAKKTRGEKKGTHGLGPCETQARRARSHESPRERPREAPRR